MSHLSNIISAQDVEVITRLLEMVEGSPFGLFEVSIGELTVRIDRPESLVVENAAVPAPAVGIYRASAVALSVGHSTTAGTILGHIDTLDQRIDVVASKGGFITNLLVDDGQFVEYGQRLLVISSAAV